MRTRDRERESERETKCERVQEIKIERVRERKIDRETEEDNQTHAKSDIRIYLEGRERNKKIQREKLIKRNLHGFKFHE